MQVTQFGQRRDLFLTNLSFFVILKPAKRNQCSYFTILCTSKDALSCSSAYLQPASSQSGFDVSEKIHAQLIAENSVVQKFRSGLFLLQKEQLSVKDAKDETDGGTLDIGFAQGKSIWKGA